MPLVSASYPVRINTVFPKLLALMKERGMDDVLLTGGGIIPEEDMLSLKQQGCGELFPPARLPPRYPAI